MRGTGGADGSHLGTCPVCDAQIPSENLVIAYEPTAGWPRMLASCPECGGPVQPV